MYMYTVGQYTQQYLSSFMDCAEAWNKQALERFCGKALESATLGEVKKHQRWPWPGEGGGREIRGPGPQLRLSVVLLRL